LLQELSTQATFPSKQHPYLVPLHPPTDGVAGEGDGGEGLGEGDGGGPGLGGGGRGLDWDLM